VESATAWIKTGDILAQAAARWGCTPCLRLAPGPALCGPWSGFLRNRVTENHCAGPQIPPGSNYGSTSTQQVDDQHH